jgi:hypothetical protein
MVVVGLGVIEPAERGVGDAAIRVRMGMGRVGCDGTLVVGQRLGGAA